MRPGAETVDGGAAAGLTGATAGADFCAKTAGTLPELEASAAAGTTGLDAGAATGPDLAAGTGATGPDLAAATDAPLENYRYLGYLGTNFDLVDGIEAKKLYFATNIFIPAQNKLGVHLGVYGNRTMTKYDTAENVTFISRRSFYKPDSIIVSTDSGRKVRTQISDNIGAFFAPVIPIYKEGDLKFYYAPNFEFVWRRNRVETDFSNNTTIRNDTIENRYPDRKSVV